MAQKKAGGSTTQRPQLAFQAPRHQAVRRRARHSRQHPRAASAARSGIRAPASAWAPTTRSSPCTRARWSSRPSATAASTFRVEWPRSGENARMTALVAPCGNLLEFGRGMIGGVPLLMSRPRIRVPAHASRSAMRIALAALDVRLRLDALMRAASRTLAGDWDVARMTSRIPHPYSLVDARSVDRSSRPRRVRARRRARWAS